MKVEGCVDLIRTGEVPANGVPAVVLIFLVGVGKFVCKEAAADHAALVLTEHSAVRIHIHDARQRAVVMGNAFDGIPAEVDLKPVDIHGRGELIKAGLLEIALVNELAVVLPVELIHAVDPYGNRIGV